MKAELEIVKFNVNEVLTATSACEDPSPIAFE